MAVARQEAEAAAAAGEVPVGAVVLFDGTIIARAHNLRETQRDPLAHAEMLALRQAARALGRWRLSGCTLVVTLEPCPMCAGAVVNSRIDQLVFGAWDARGGAVGSLCNIVADARLNHRAEVIAGFEADAAAALLRTFFRARRRPPKRSAL
jgi:tRNA(adenine34) deaminase